jgi:putative SbcD/Mre11-related phosphoesterase
MSRETDLLPIDPDAPEGWHLAPEGAVVHRAARTAVIADVHLGYEWARGARGDVVPPHSLTETLAALGMLLGRATIERLVVAGDLVESPRPCARTAGDVARLGAWLASRGVALITLQGNHDPPARPPRPASIELHGWLIHHGHADSDAPRMILGHYHPILRQSGVEAPCFLVGAGLVVLPAFSRNAAGLDVRAARWPGRLGGGDVRCVAALDGELFDLGTRGRLGRLREIHQ